ncbi:MAG: SIR2 family protein [Chlorobaculum sp.]|jgi:tetratricopeptide (TPR) repeat protein|nr:SIR2 family protein [Chlorobaculum sp.]
MPASVTLDEILAINGNRAVYERLQALMADGSAMAFVGAGASFPLYPLWPQLLEALADEPVKRGLANSADKAQWLRAAGQKPLHVAARIHDKLKDNFYHTFLYETFKDRIGSDALGYTPAQAALVRANFKALLTTNYDAGLVEARRVLRPDIRNTGFAVWNQNFAVNRWASGDLFHDGTPCPILFAHGHFADPSNVVLDSASYRRAYQTTPYRRLFENLWLQEHLVFVGFSFNDAVLAQIADEVLWSTARQGGGAPRHVAILGLDEEHQYTPEMRHEYLEPFNAEVLFYPVRRGVDGRPDHSALQVVLESLCPSPEIKREARTELVAPSPDRQVAMEFVHESTDDQLFTGRDAVLERLDGWSADAGVRLVGISAIGGLGKTALLGHWLKSSGAAHGSDGIFFWSYYRDSDTDAMLRALLKFGREQLQWKPARCRSDAPPIEQVMELLGERRLIVALDGLELVQESPGTVAYGKLLSLELADLLHRHGRERGSALASSLFVSTDSEKPQDKGALSSRHSSLIVLTSRFPFPDLTAYLGGSLRTLPLPELEPSKGSELLYALGVHGRAEEREEISRKLFGHPLALRVFARSMPAELAGDPTRLWQQVFDAPHLDGSDSLAGKMQRLLTFYEQRLTESQRQALGLLAIFRMPVGETTLSVLWERFKPDVVDGTLRAILDGLHREHLLIADVAADGTPRYACHPILRDHFRGCLLGQTALICDVAQLLGDRPDVGQHQSLESIHLFVAAIELLLEAGDFKAADDLYRTRLNNGHIFQWLPAPHWGMEVARWFIRDEKRCFKVREQLNNSDFYSYMNSVGFYAYLSGESETSLEFYSQVVDLRRATKDWKKLSENLINFCETKVSLGLLIEACGHLAESLKMARMIGDKKQILDSLVWDAFISSMLGDLALADAAFGEANAIEHHFHDYGDLLSIRGIMWAEHMLRSGDCKRSRQLTISNCEISLNENWQNTIAQCDWLLGWVDVLEDRLDEAAEHLRAARGTFFRGHMIYYLARTWVTESAMWLGRGEYRAALDACERARELAAPRKYRMVHADALVQRARLWLSLPEPQPGRARDDAEAALQLAEFCNYAWAQRDATELLATAYGQLGQPDDSARYQTEFAQWKQRLSRKE